MPFWGTQETLNMRDERARGFWHAVALPAVTAAAMLSLASAAHAQGAAPKPPSFEVYGFGQADAIADFKQTNPDWFDVARPSRLPAFANQFGEDGRFHLSARQSRLGVRATLPTSTGDVKAQ